MTRPIAILLLCAASSLVQAQSLGRLFYSDDERAQLERQRGQAVPQVGAPRTGGTLRHDGVVLRSAGPATWFVNGAALDSHTLPSVPARPAGTALQLPGSDGRAVHLRPGEHTELDEAGRAAPPADAVDIRPGRVQ